MAKLRPDNKKVLFYDSCGELSFLCPFCGKRASFDSANSMSVWTCKHCCMSIDRGDVPFLEFLVGVSKNGENHSIWT